MERVLRGFAWLGLVWIPVLALLALIDRGLVFLLWLGAVFTYDLSFGHVLLGLGETIYGIGAVLFASTILLLLAYLVGGAERKLLATILSLALLPAILLVGLVISLLLAAAGL